MVHSLALLVGFAEVPLLDMYENPESDPYSVKMWNKRPKEGPLGPVPNWSHSGTSIH